MTSTDDLKAFVHRTLDDASFDYEDGDHRDELVREAADALTAALITEGWAPPIKPAQVSEALQAQRLGIAAALKLLDGLSNLVDYDGFDGATQKIRAALRGETDGQQSSSSDTTLTAYVSIGNSDDKLSQREWSDFVADFRRVMTRYASEIYGVWYSAPDAEYQNMCIAAAVRPGSVDVLRGDLTEMREHFQQDSVAWAFVDETEFI